MEKDIKIEIGQILLELRKSKGYSQSEIAKYLGITTAAYQNYEAGRREMNYTNIHKLADFYNVTTDYLLAREPKKEIDPIELLPIDDWKKALLRLYITIDSERRPEMIEIIKKIANGADTQLSIDKQKNQHQPSQLVQTVQPMPQQTPQPVQPIRPQQPLAQNLQQPVQRPTMQNYPQQAPVQPQPQQEEQPWIMAARSADGKFFRRVMTPEEVELIESLEDAPESAY